MAVVPVALEVELKFELLCQYVCDVGQKFARLLFGDLDQIRLRHLPRTKTSVPRIGQPGDGVRTVHHELLAVAQELDRMPASVSSQKPCRDLGKRSCCSE